MKKALILPVMAIALMVSQTWAQTECKQDGAVLYCQWSTGCNSISTQYSYIDGTCTAGNCTCTQLVDNCKTNGGLYSGVNPSALNEGNNYGTGVSCSANGGTLLNTPSEPCGSYCKWPTGCTEIKTDPTGANNGGTPVTSCSAAIENCDNNGTRYSNSSCTGTPIGGVESCGQWCKWPAPTGCIELKPDPTGQYNDGTPIPDCATATSNCSANGELFSSQAACNSGGTDPIIVSGRSVGLTVIPNGNVLHIISERNATVELFSMNGAKVFSSKVAAGNSTLSLEKQRQGVYYAVVKSGSQKQTVKVVLK